MKAAMAVAPAAPPIGGAISEPRNISAFCGPNGIIHFGAQTPKWSIEIVSGPDKRLRRYIDMVARHGYENGELLVPGMAEAADEKAALLALQDFIHKVSENAPTAIFNWNRRCEVTQ